MSEDRPRLTYEQRRARREERRAKQRLANVGRAAKMHTARLHYEADHSPSTSSPKPGHYVGCSGWYYWHWGNGLFYPRDIPRTDWFPHYASHFRTVELNAPFYSWPTLATVQTWLKQAAPHRNFIYTIKVSELITHVKRFTRTKTLVKDFGLIADLLGPRMGCFLFQLPPSFHYTPARLKNILSQLDPRHRNVVEFRHRTWWNETVYKSFRNANAIFCSISAPRLPDDLVKTADDLYLRFHGTKRWYRHDYTPEELSTWVQRIRDANPTRTWTYFNNDREGFAIKNAKELIRQLKSKR